ncbi:MAG: NERD domain-containing protein, partial [Bacilli bacterium]|nr:NERD domain-containing protein [Bacilli bacterium]
MTNKKRDIVASWWIILTSLFIASFSALFMLTENPYIIFLIIYCAFLPLVVTLPIAIYFRWRTKFYWYDGLEYRRPTNGVVFGYTTNDDEAKVAKILQFNGGSSSYLFNNVVLPYSKGGELQIDHILLSEAGVFVVEVIPVEGTIKGNLEDPKWTLNRKKEIDNPTNDNLARCTAVREAIGDVKCPVFSCIVYTNANTRSLRSVNILNTRWLKKLLVHHYIRHHVAMTDLVVMADRIVKKRILSEEAEALLKSYRADQQKRIKEIEEQIRKNKEHTKKL